MLFNSTPRVSFYRAPRQALCALLLACTAIPSAFAADYQFTNPFLFRDYRDFSAIGGGINDVFQIDADVVDVATGAGVPGLTTVTATSNASGATYAMRECGPTFLCYLALIPYDDAEATGRWTIEVRVGSPISMVAVRCDRAARVALALRARDSGVAVTPSSSAFSRSMSTISWANTVLRDHFVASASVRSPSVPPRTFHLGPHTGAFSISIGDVAIAPSDPDVIWVGTGEANNQRSSYWGNGIYKSTDGGKTWKNTGLRKSFQVGAIVLVDDRVVGIERAPSHDYWLSIWPSLIRERWSPANLG